MDGPIVVGDDSKDEMEAPILEISKFATHDKDVASHKYNRIIHGLHEKIRSQAAELYKVYKEIEVLKANKKLSKKQNLNHISSLDHLIEYNTKMETGEKRARCVVQNGEKIVPEKLKSFIV